MTLRQMIFWFLMLAAMIFGHALIMTQAERIKIRHAFLAGYDARDAELNGAVAYPVYSRPTTQPRSIP